jgi:hypothetical protein
MSFCCGVLLFPLGVRILEWLDRACFDGRFILALEVHSMATDFGESIGSGSRRAMADCFSLWERDLYVYTSLRRVSSQASQQVKQAQDQMHVVVDDEA